MDGDENVDLDEEEDTGRTETCKAALLSSSPWRAQRIALTFVRRWADYKLNQLHAPNLGERVALTVMFPGDVPP